LVPVLAQRSVADGRLRSRCTPTVASQAACVPLIGISCDGDAKFVKGGVKVDHRGGAKVTSRGTITGICGGEEFSVRWRSDSGILVGPPTAVKFGPLGRYWLGFIDGATEA